MEPVLADRDIAGVLFTQRSTDGGQSFTKAAAIASNGYQLQPFDQGSSVFTFRTNAYPAITVVPAAAGGPLMSSPHSTSA